MLEVSEKLRLSSSFWTDTPDNVPLVVAVTGESDQKKEEEEDREGSSSYWQ